jgi:hypothetical protein
MLLHGRPDGRMETIVHHLVGLNVEAPAVFGRDGVQCLVGLGGEDLAAVLQGGIPYRVQDFDLLVADGIPTGWLITRATTWAVWFFTTAKGPYLPALLAHMVERRA